MKTYPALIGVAVANDPQKTHVQLISHIGLDLNLDGASGSADCSLRFLTQGPTALEQTFDGTCTRHTRPARIDFQFNEAGVLKQNYVWYSFSDAISAGSILTLSWEEGTWHGYLTTSSHVFQIIFTPVNFNLDECRSKYPACTLNKLNGIDAETGNSLSGCHQECNSDTCGFDVQKCIVKLPTMSPTNDPTPSPTVMPPKIARGDDDGSALMHWGIAFAAIAVIGFAVFQKRASEWQESTTAKHASLENAAEETVVPNPPPKPPINEKDDDNCISVSPASTDIVVS